MTRLEDLLNSLATLLVRYHLSQVKSRAITDTDPAILLKKSREHAIKILQAGEPKFDKEFDRLIKECTVDYALRSPFLFYILNEINYVKSMVERKNPFRTKVEEPSNAPSELDVYKQQMRQIFTNFIKLLTTVKSQSTDVTYTSFTNGSEVSVERKVSLRGLKNDDYLGPFLCASGQYLTSAVLERFHLTATSTPEEVNDLVENICAEHQNTLLIPELLKEKKELVDLTSTQKLIIEEQQASIQLLKIQPKVPVSTPPQTEPESTTVIVNDKLKEASERIKELEAINLKQLELIAALKKVASKPLGTGLAYGALFGPFGLNSYKFTAQQKVGQVQSLEEDSSSSLLNE